jgi:hypothetical protein
MIEGNGPGENIGGFHVEDEKKSSNQIKGDRISEPGRAGRNDTAFIGFQFFWVRSLFTEPAGDEKENDDQNHRHQREDPECQNPWFPWRKNSKVWNGFHQSS